MSKTARKAAQRARIRRRVRSKISGTAERPRLNVFRSNKHMYAQLIDDLEGQTLAAAGSMDPSIDVSEKSPTEVGKAVGQLLAERAKDAGISTCVFDRGGYRYHGRVKALADGAREGGLQF
jgi:large subunit ribosomal protein L18